MKVAVYDIINCGPRHQFAANGKVVKNSSRGLQLHNMRRDAHKPEDVTSLRQMLLAGQTLDAGTAMTTLAKLLRPALIPAPGNSFAVADWSAIENRMLPWLADDPQADAKLQIFRDVDEAKRQGRSARDTYEIAAANAGFEDRQIGKVIELSLGYGGAAGAFTAMAKNYGVHLPEAEIRRVVRVWRETNAWAVRFWRQLDRALKQAIRRPGTPSKAGRITYTYIPGMMGGSVLCELPGGHFITYPKVTMRAVTTQHGTDWEVTSLKANWKPKKGEKQWPRYRLWGGLQAENCTQATAAALLREALRQLDYVVMHCHDEIALEVPTDEAQHHADRLQRVMENPATWAEGLPLSAPAVVMQRYGKP